MATVSDPLTIDMDIPLSAIKERGYGAHLNHTGLRWTYSNVMTTYDQRGYMLAPLQWASDWYTNTAGDYARKRLASDFIQQDVNGNASATSWDEVERFATGNYWAYVRGGNGRLVTAGSGWSGGSGGLLAANTHFFIDVWAYGVPANTDWIMQAVFGGGSRLWRFLLAGDGTGLLMESADSGATWNTRATGPLFKAGNATEGPIRLWFAPVYRRCLYVIANGGEELRFEDLSLDPGTADYTDPAATAPIVPAGTLAVTAYAKMAVQVTEVRFKPSGGMDGTLTLPYAPLTNPIQFTDLSGDSLHWKDTPAGTSVAVSTSFVADGSNKNVPLDVDLATTDTRRTPTLYAIGLRLDPVAVERAATRYKLLSAVSPDLTLRMDPERTTLTLPIMNNAELVTKHNRGVLLSAGTAEPLDEVFRGLTSYPEADEDNPLETVTYEVEDEWKRLDNTLLPNTSKFDGWLVTDVVKYILMFCGYDETRWDIDTSTVRIPDKKSNQNTEHDAAGKEPLVQPSTGTRAGDFLRHIRDTYLDWFMDFAPVDRDDGTGTGNMVRLVAFRFKNPDTLPTTPAVTLYRSTAGAKAAGKDWRHTINNLRSREREPECTQVHVFGQAPGGGYIYARFPDTDYVAAEDAELPEEDRPSNWLGEPRYIIIIDVSLASEEACTQAASMMYAKTGYRYEELTFNGQYFPDLRRHDMIEIAGRGNYRLVAMQARFPYESTNNGYWHRFRDVEFQVERKIP